MTFHRIHGMTIGMPHCWGILGSGDKTSVSAETDTVASDEALAQGGSFNRNIGAGANDLSGGNAAQGEGAQGGSFNRNIGASAVDQSAGQGTIALDGGLSQGGYASRNLAAGAIDLNSSSNNTITVGASAADVRALAGDFTTALNKQGASSSDTLGTVLNKLTPLAESKQTDGEPGKNNIVLWVVLAAFGLLGVALFRE